MSKLRRTLEYDDKNDFDREFIKFVLSNRFIEVAPDIRLTGNRLLKYWVAEGYRKTMAREKQTNA